METKGKQVEPPGCEPGLSRFEPDWSPHSRPRTLLVRRLDCQSSEAGPIPTGGAIFAGVAQLEERRGENAQVVGSCPTSGTTLGP